jgi:hypothetical protein
MTRCESQRLMAMISMAGFYWRRRLFLRSFAALRMTVVLRWDFQQQFLIYETLFDRSKQKGSRNFREPFMPRTDCPTSKRRLNSR